MKLTLRLRRREQPLHEPAAWFFPGEDPARWFPEIAASCDDPDTARVRVVRAGGKCCGILVTWSGARRQGGASGVPYGRIGSRFYLPLDSELDPPAAVEELAALLAPERDYVFTPAAGLAGFDPAEVYRLSDLQQAPELRGNDWGCAQPGLAFSRRLHSLLPLDMPSPEQFLREGGGDIGSRAEQGAAPPPGGDEPSEAPLANLARGLAAGAQWLANQLPRGNPPGFIGRAIDWAVNQLSSVNAANEFLRNKEINRLLKLIETNPDEGLRFALPLDDMNASRGTAPPSNYLPPRLLDFRGGGRSGPADVWRIDNERRMQLHRRYRQLAERELSLGRYRRAAYIFAHLLNDLVSAAGALKSGKHWREAAALYKDRLNRAADAAKCLIEGGLLGEAIPILTELGQLEEAGDLQMRLSEEEAARDLYDRAMRKALARMDHLTAARLLEEKLHRAEEALSTLWQAWPHANQADACLKKFIARLGETGRKAELLERLETIRDQHLPLTSRGVRLTVLGEQAHSAGVDEVRAFAADAIRIVAARDLLAAEETETRQLMQALRRLAEGDKVLECDTVRYQRLRTMRRNTQPPKPAGKSRLNLIQRCVLWTERPTNWIRAVVSREVIYTVGSCDGRLVIGRVNWAGSSEVISSFRNIVSEVHLVLAVGDDVASKLWLHLPDSALPKNERSLTGTNNFPVVSISHPPFSDRQRLIGLTMNRDGIFSIAETREGCVLHTVLPGGEAHSRILPTPESEPHLPVPMVMSKGLEIGWGSRLIGEDVFEFGRQITALSTTPPTATRRTAVSLDQGGIVTWYNAATGRSLLNFGGGQSDLLTAFTRTGQLVYCGPAGGEVLEFTGDTLRSIARVEPSESRPIAVLPRKDENQFAVVLDDGRVLIYAV